MTAQGGDILAWLETAITTREEVAREAARSYGPRWVRPVDTDVVKFADFDIWFQVLNEEIAEHVVYNSPESVLRRCAADRRLIAEHGPFSDDDRACKGCGLDFCEELITGYYADCPVLLAIAEGYGWTEGER